MSDDPARALILSYAPPRRKPGLEALLALDDALGALLRTTSEPALGQLRLAWWRESLPKLDSAPAPAEPVLQGISAHVLPQGATGASLVPVVHGWEVLIEEEQLDAAALQRFAKGRGSLFAAAGVVLGAAPGDPLELAGQGWALADLADNLSAPHEAQAARALARPLLSEALGQRWSRQARSLGAMAHLARMELENSGGPVWRVGRLFWHRLSGR